MMQNNRRIRGLAIVTGGVLAASALLAPTPVQADKADTLKIGASVLGAAAAVLASKGKTVPAAIAGAAGYYVYKKGRDEDRKKNDYPYYGQAGTYPQYPAGNYPSYPSNNHPTYGGYPTSNYPTDYPTSNYPSNSYPTYQEPASYPSYPSGGYYGGNNTGYDSYPNSYRAVAPQSAAPAPRSMQKAPAPKVVLR